ncbi:pheromone A receptor-domain-containing protein [Mycena metata]|uniref:Pheromone A receptor-domain-containing protein n=1 Tax=Mycena metata TaxID=1033252 RepID=A0AAD7IYF9_9AGAR|nr:pheromone A receptor-domain-containing protein [Mycena metata]
MWPQTTADLAPVCDAPIAIGIPAASLCINRRLYKIASCQTVSVSRAQKQRAVLVDLAINLRIPFVQMPLRTSSPFSLFDSFLTLGVFRIHRLRASVRHPRERRVLPHGVQCRPAYPLSYLWLNIINLVSAVYCILTLRAFLHRSAQFAQFLSASALTPTPNRYFRLMALASLELLLNLPLASYGLFLTASRSPIAPWVSWANTHADFARVQQVPALFWRSDKHTEATVELSRWAGVVCALAFFAFFGFAAEARKHYRMAFWAVGKRVGFAPPADGAFPFPFTVRLPWAKRAPTTGSAAKGLPIALPLTPVKQRPESLSPSLADTRTDADTDYEHEKGSEGYVLPTPSTDSMPPQYAHDVELGAYVPYPYPSPSSERTLTGGDDARRST